MPSPCQCILSEPGALLGGWVHLLFLVFPLLNPDTGEQSRPTGMCPCGVESQRERKIKPEAENGEPLMCFVWPTLFLKMVVLSHV